MDLAMTGELTVVGEVLPIGGVREKVLAAQRYGLQRIVVPRDNEPDLEELPDEPRKELDFILADTIEDVFAVAFSAPGRSRPQATPASERQAAASV